MHRWFAEVGEIEWLRSEPANGHIRPVDRKRRDGDIDSASIGETGIDERSGSIDT